MDVTTHRGSTGTRSTVPAAAHAKSLDLGGRRTLFVASTGGHLTELHLLAPGMNSAPDSVWVTFDSEQSRSLLPEATRRFVPYVSPRAYRATLRAVRPLYDILRAERPAAVVSTGAAVALSAFLAARLLGVPCYYVESVSRIAGPSLTGRLVAALRLAELRTQQHTWAGRRWEPHPSVLAGFEPVPLGRGRPLPLHPRLFVTLGTIHPYRFDALLDAVLATGLADERTVWQLGATTRDDLPGRVVQELSADEFLACCTDADVVVTHAGVGTAITLLEAGVRPVVVPRRAVRGEHVDDHQTQIAALLGAQGLAEVVEAAALSAATITRATGRRVRRRTGARAA